MIYNFLLKNYYAWRINQADYAIAQVNSRIQDIICLYNLDEIDAIPANSLLIFDKRAGLIGKKEKLEERVKFYFKNS